MPGFRKRTVIRAAPIARGLSPEGRAFLMAQLTRRLPRETENTAVRLFFIRLGILTEIGEASEHSLCP